MRHSAQSPGLQGPLGGGRGGDGGQKSGRGANLPTPLVLLWEEAAFVLFERSADSGRFGTRGESPKGRGAGWTCSSSSGAASQAPLHEASSEEKTGDGDQDLGPRQSTGGTAGNRLEPWALCPERKPHHTLGTHTTPHTIVHHIRTTTYAHIIRRNTHAHLTPSWTSVGSPAHSVPRQRPWR